MEPRRVIVLGTSGAGKSTFARELAGLRGCGAIDLDDLHWEPNWTEVPDDVFRARVDAATRGDDWVVAGNYLVARDVHWPRATDLVWLDLSRPLVMRRVIGRTFRRVFTRELVCNGNREDVKLAFFSKDSVIWWAWTTYASRRRELAALFEGLGGPRVHRPRTPAEAAALLKALAK